MVSIDVWRSRVGGFNARIARQRLCQSSKSDSSIHSFALPLCTILYLLVIGNVERNPGPNFICENCNFGSSSGKNLLKHQQVHCSSSNFQFKCPIPTCYLTFSKYDSAVKHFTRVHKSSSSSGVCASNQQVQRLPCSAENCHETFLTTADLCHHFIDHLASSTMRVLLECPLQCKLRTFSQERTPKFSSVQVFRTHLSVKHKGWNENVSCYTVQNQQEGDDQTPRQLESEDDCDHSLDGADEDAFFDASDNSDDEDGMFSFDNAVESIGKFYLMLEGKFLLPATTVQDISEFIKFISELVQIGIKQTLKKEIGELKLTPEKGKQIIQRVLTSDPLFASHHIHSRGPSFITEDRRNTYYKQHFGYVDVIEMNASPRDTVGKYCHYFPPKEILNMVLQDKSVERDILESFTDSRSDSLVIDNYTKGTVHSGIESFKTIDIMIFIDAFNMVNPLGAAKNLYKTVGIYMSIMNLKPFNRAKIAAMNMIMLIQEKYLEACNFKKAHKFCQVSCSHQKCLTRLINDLNTLHRQGIMFCGEQVKVCLKVVVGDNLGAHIIGGLLCGFSKSIYFCRFCDVTRGAFNGNPHFAIGRTRTVQHFQECIRKLKWKRLAKVTKSYKGVRFDSLLNRISGYNIGLPGLPSCLGHDFFEGAASWDLRVVIDHLITKQWIGFSNFVQLLKEFVCVEYDSGNKPKSISKDSKKGLGLHAVQTWFVLRNLSLLVGDKVLEADDKYWELYLKLKAVSEYICAPRLKLSQIDEMEALISRYLQMRRDLGLKFKPKHHFLLHYPETYRKLGPLISLWGMRFESLHSLFKRFALAGHNYINVTKTMASKYQLYFAYQSTGPLLKTNVEAPKHVGFHDYTFDHQSKEFVSQKFSTTALVAEEAELSGLCLKKTHGYYLDRQVSEMYFPLAK